MPHYIDIALPSFDAVRTASLDGRPDTSDCAGVAEAQAAKMREHLSAWKEGRLVIHDPTAVSAAPSYQQFNPRGGIAASRGSTAGNAQAGLSATGSASGAASFDISAAAKMVMDTASMVRECAAMSRRDGGTPQPGCDPIQHCGSTPLGFNTYETAGYPLTGVVLGTIAEGPVVRITAGRAWEYQPLWLYLSARDTAANFAEVQGYMTSARVNDNSQLAGDSLTNRPLDSDLYRNIGPLMLDNWNPWTNTDPDVLLTTFGHALGPAADVAFSGAFFGQATFKAA